MYKTVIKRKLNLQKYIYIQLKIITIILTLVNIVRTLIFACVYHLMLKIVLSDERVK